MVGKRWTSDEISFLKSNYKNMFYSDIGKEIGRSQHAIKLKAESLNLSPGRRYKTRPQLGEDNPNWKGGISKNNYHYKKIQVKRYPKRILARQAVMDALKSGRLIRPDECEECGKECKPDGHHEDYDKPLEVDWLCKDCHRDKES